MDDSKDKKAVALRYRHGQDPAPRIVARGKGTLAEKIIAVAKAHQVPCVEDLQLVEMLIGLDINTEIPEELYRAVAQVLVFVYRMEQEFSRS